MKNRIYADHAATTKLDKDAFEAMVPYLLNDYGNPSQPYSFARPAKKALGQAREEIAACIGANPSEIYFTSGGTESDNWIIKGLGLGQPHYNVITSQIEHHAILNSCLYIEKIGGKVCYLPVDFEGTISTKVLKDTISNQTDLVSIMMANNEIGTIEPIKELCEIAHQEGSLFHTDAVQAVGHIPVNVKELGVDFLSASAHKFNGPKGIGFLYARDGIAFPPYIDGGRQELNKRAGTENIAAIVGMATALKKNCNVLTQAGNSLKSMEQVFYTYLSDNKIDFRINGPRINRLPGNINISIRNANGEMLLHRLDLMGISVSTGSACDSGSEQLSHVIKAIVVPDDFAPGTLRISLGAENTIEDTKLIAEALVSIIK